MNSSKNIELILLNQSQYTNDNYQYDPHTWISPFIAKQQAHNIYEILIEADANHENYYTSQWNTFKTQLETLDNQYMENLSGGFNASIIVNHAAFGYLAYRYGFEQNSILDVLGSQRPDLSIIVDIVELIIEKNIYVIYTNPNYSKYHVDAIIETVEIQTGRELTTLQLYTMLGPINDLDYIEQQEKNLINFEKGIVLN